MSESCAAPRCRRGGRSAGASGNRAGDGDGVPGRRRSSRHGEVAARTARSRRRGDPDHVVRYGGDVGGWSVLPPPGDRGRTPAGGLRGGLRTRRAGIPNRGPTTGSARHPTSTRLRCGGRDQRDADGEAIGGRAAPGADGVALANRERCRPDTGRRRRVDARRARGVDVPELQRLADPAARTPGAVLPAPGRRSAGALVAGDGLRHRAVAGAPDRQYRGGQGRRFAGLWRRRRRGRDQPDSTPSGPHPHRGGRPLGEDGRRSRYRRDAVVQPGRGLDFRAKGLRVQGAPRRFMARSTGWRR